MAIKIILSFPVLYLIALSGMLAHFMTIIKGEKISDVTGYFADHFKSTLFAFIVTTVFFLSYYILMRSGQKSDIIAVFMGGYLFDSFIRKFEPGTANLLGGSLSSADKAAGGVRGNGFAAPLDIEPGAGRSVRLDPDASRTLNIMAGGEVTPPAGSASVGGSAGVGSAAASVGGKSAEVKS